MKTVRIPLTLLFLGVALQAQDAAPPAATGAASVPPGSTSTLQRTAEELDQLLAPIALYPDALIALILPAATVPADIVLAARYLHENPGDRSQIEHRAWDESVKSLTNYPDVVKWMDENLQWTKQVGEAFAAQSADVMQAVQRLRAKARAAGTLIDTPQQQVLAEQQIIRIVPAQPDIIYVPHYEPEIVFVDRPVYYSRPFLTFGVGVPVGSWLAFDCDWRRNTIWVGNRHRRWTGHNWHRPVVPIAPGHGFTRTPEVRRWSPPPQHPRPTVTVGHRYRSEIARPVPIAVTSSRSYSYRDRGSDFFERQRASNPLPAINPLPHSFTAPRPSELPGPRVPSASRTSRATPTVNAPAAPMPDLQPLPLSRRSGGDGSRDGDARSFRSSSHINATPRLPTVPALPMATPAPAHNPQPMGPAPQRSFSRGAPPARSPSVPAVVPSLPMASRSSAPAPTVGPVAPAPAPAAPRSGGGESRGHRGSGGGRHQDQAH